MRRLIARSAVLEGGDALLPTARDGDRPVFNEAWEAQAFAMVVAMHDAKLFSWSEWTAALSREIAAASPTDDREAGDSYYRHWLAALESLVVEKGAASRAALASRKEAWGRAAEATPHGRSILLANDPQAALSEEGRKSHWERVYTTRAETEVSGRSGSLARGDRAGRRELPVGRHRRWRRGVAAGRPADP
jgi:nitrile hydratase accessory protein